MNIETILDKGINWINQNSKSKLFGTIDNNNSTTILCDTKEHSIEDFLEIGKVNGVTIFVIYKSIFSIDAFLTEIATDTLDDSKQKQYNQQLKKLKEYQGQLYFLSFLFTADGIAYEYEVLADWFKKAKAIKDKIEVLLEDDVARAWREKKEKSLPRNKIKQLSEALARKESFFVVRNDFVKLGLLLDEVLEENNINESDLGRFDETEIRSSAKTFFQRKLIKQKEIELVQKIAELKEQGNSKIAIRSKLGLTKGMLDKYYYK